MSDRFNDQGILDSVLLSPQLELASKRAMLRVSRFFHEITDLHLRQPELHVSDFDCTIDNARFVLRVLMPRVPGLLVCARGERFTPKMDFRKLRTLPNIRVNTPTCCMGETAAFFLGHALAQSNGNVRLTMGRKKSLLSLRERSRVYLDEYERLEEVDRNLVAGALLVNAETRIAQFNGKDLDLSSLYLNPTTLKHLEWPLYEAFDGAHHGPYRKINMCHNPVGALGAKILANALCSRRRSSAVHVQILDLSYTKLGDEGVAMLAAPMPGGGFKIQELLLASVNMGNAGLKELMHGLRALSDRFGSLRRREKDFREDTTHDVQVLDLSDNVFNDQGFEELFEPVGLSRLRILNIRRLRRVSKRSLVRLGNEVRDGLYPSIEDIYCETDGPGHKDVPIHKAVRYWEAQRSLKRQDAEWKGFLKQFEHDSIRGGDGRFLERRSSPGPVDLTGAYD